MNNLFYELQNNVNTFYQRVYQYFYKDKDVSEQKRYYENGQLKSQKFYKDGIIDGEQKVWYESGKLLIKYCYKDGLQDGEYKEYYESGKLKSKRFYIDGMLDGEQKEWFENGKLSVQQFYKDGIRYPQNIISLQKRIRKNQLALKIENLVKQEGFIQSWYHPDNKGGWMAKKKMMELFTV
jgi:antitoxin component YwqK of YwqJK toxin-antitoxin module